jgi:hypothetical protein
MVKRLIAFVFLLTIFTLPARAQSMTAAMTGGKLLADCHEQIRMFNMPYAHVGNGIDASILPHRSLARAHAAER